MRRYGSMGLRLARLARGEDFRAVSPERRAKSISAETTFDRDIGAESELLPHLRELTEKVSARLKRQGLAGRLVVLKLKTGRLPPHHAERQPRRIYQPRRPHFPQRARPASRRRLTETKYRLIGIGVGDLGDASLVEPADLIDASAEKRASAERAMDTIRERFGREGLALGLTFTARPRGGDA